MVLIYHRTLCGQPSNLLLGIDERQEVIIFQLELSDGTGGRAATTRAVWYVVSRVTIFRHRKKICIVLFWVGSGRVPPYSMLSEKNTTTNIFVLVLFMTFEHPCKIQRGALISSITLANKSKYVLLKCLFRPLYTITLEDRTWV